jgi:hypothetical protein
MHKSGQRRDIRNALLNTLEGDRANQLPILEHITSQHIAIHFHDEAKRASVGIRNTITYNVIACKD